MEFYLLNEEETSEEIRQQINRRKVIRDNSNPLDLDPDSFKKNFRVSKNVFREILETMELHLHSTISTAIPNILKLAACLRFFATGSYQRGISNDINANMGQSTFSTIFKETRDIFERFICSRWIKLQFSEREKEEAKLSFFRRCNFPGVIGCVDGTHVAILKPPEEIQHLYYNRKGFHSLNVMIICDHKMMIRFVNARFPGSCHDSMVWNLSQAKETIRNIYESSGGGIWLLGDSGYPLEPHLMTPYRSPVSDAQTKYNTLHSKGRIIVERTIGVLKNRFRCLLKARQLNYSPETATQIVNCCVAIHNMCTYYNDAIEDIPAADEYEISQEMEINESEIAEEATRNRERICSSLM